MEQQLPRLDRQVVGSAEASFLVDPATGQPAVFNTLVVGTPASANSITLFDIDLTGVVTALVDIRGTFVAGVTFEQTVDGTNWFVAQGTAIGAPGSPVTAVTSSNVLAFPALGRRFRARTTSYTSGTVTSSVVLTNVPSTGLLNGATLNVVPTAATGSGGLLINKVRATVSLNLTSVKTTNTRLYAWRLFNAAASPRYLKFYNKASAPVVATDVPVFTIVLAAGQVADFDTAQGVSFGTGLAYAITGALTDTDATNTVADDVVGTILYS